MRSVLPFLITGVATGSLYGLSAVGLVLTYRSAGVFNLAHGAVAAAAAFVFHTLWITTGLPWPLAAVLTITLFGFVGGVALEALTRALRELPTVVEVVATVGLLLAVQGLLFVVYGTETRPFPAFLPTSGFTVAGVNVSWEQVITVLVATISAVGLWFFLGRSRLGVAVRGVVDNPRLVALAGGSPRRIRLTAWWIGSAFAALSGILLAPTLGLDVLLLTMLVIQAFGAAALGTFSNLVLTYAGGIVVGVAASVATRYFAAPPWNGIPASVPFLVLVGVLLIRPARRFPARPKSTVRPGGNGATAAAAASSNLVPGVVGLAALIAVPLIVGTKLPVWTAALSSAVIFASLALLVWTSGQISLCQASFAAVGATTFAHLRTDAGLPWGVALIGAGLLTVPVGALVAIPSLRLSGIYLALATLGFAILLQNVVFPTELMFGSSLSVTTARPKLGALDGADDTTMYYLVLAVTVAVLVSLAAIGRSRLGRLLEALAEAPTMLSTNGLEVSMVRLTVFCLSAFVAGIGGALTLAQTGAASGVAYGPVQSLILVTVLALCGTRLVRSPILAAGLLSVVPGYLTGFSLQQQSLVFGACATLAALLMAARPRWTSWVSQAAAGSAGRWAGRREPVARHPSGSGDGDAAAGVAAPPAVANGAATLVQDGVRV